jgi:hypothetical protein
LTKAAAVVFLAAAFAATALVPQKAGAEAAIYRGSDLMPLAQLAWKKCEDDGLIVARLGVLDNDLGKVWQPTQPHVSVRQLRDWFAQFPYLSKLRWPVSQIRLSGSR